MKMRQKLIAVLAASMIVTSVPVVTMADTKNYVSAARYAKEGTTYGYTVKEYVDPISRELRTFMGGVTGLREYTDFNGFEFSPIMNYSNQNGSMFMSLTNDTKFNAEAILAYADSFNVSMGDEAWTTGIWIDKDGKIQGATNRTWNGRTADDVLSNEGVTLRYASYSNDGVAKPAQDMERYINSLKPNVANQIKEDMKNDSGKYYVSRGLVEDDILTLVESTVDKVSTTILKNVDDIGNWSPARLEEFITKTAEAVAQAVVDENPALKDEITKDPVTTGPATTVAALYMSSGAPGGDLLSVNAIAQEATKLMAERVQEAAPYKIDKSSPTIRIQKVESFEVEDVNGRKYNSHLRVDLTGNFKKDVTYKVPLLAKIGGDKQVILNIDGKDSFITSEKYNITQEAVSNKRLTVLADSKSIRTNYAEEIGEIKLTETEIGSLVAGDTEEDKDNKVLGAHAREIKITLPSSSGLEFNLDKTERNITLTGKRGFYGKVADNKDRFDKEHDHAKHDEVKLTYGISERRNEDETDKQTLIITLPDWKDPSAKGEIALSGLYVQPIDETAPTGEVKVTISEYVDSKDYSQVARPTDKSTNLLEATTVKVAEVKEYDVTLTCEKPVDIKAGRSGIINDKYVTFTLQEAVKDSLADGRKIGFELENGYIFGAADVQDLDEEKSYSTTTYKNKAQKRFEKLITDKLIKLKVNGEEKAFNTDDLKLTFDAEGRVVGFSTIYNDLSETKADKIEMTIPVATSVMSTGEVKVVAKNLTTRSFQDKEDPSAVVAKVASPIEVTFDGAKLKVGLQAQEAGSITIKETDKGMLERGWLFLTADINSGITFDKVPTVTIQSADGKEVKVENVALNKARTVLGLEVSKTSLEASTIKISDVVLTADRTVPEANYDLVMWGSALTDESVRDIHGFDKAVNTYAYFGEGSDVYKVKEFVQMTTKNTEDITDSNNKAVTAKFVIGESKFTVNGEEVAMDSAAYVKNSYTFVPVKYVAKAFGIEGNAVQYDKATSTATIIAGNKVINITNGKPFIVVNGTQVPMAAKAEVKEGRMCVPMAYIAAALDVQKSWDSATKTATFTNVTAPAAQAAATQQ